MPVFIPEVMKVRSAVLYDPKRSGKTHHFEAIAKKLGLRRIVKCGGVPHLDKLDTLYICESVPDHLLLLPCYSIEEFTKSNGKFYLGAEQMEEPAKYEAAVKKEEFGEESPLAVEKTLSIHIDSDVGRFPDRLLLSCTRGVEAEYRKVEKPKPKFEIIGITGKKRSGKDTLADEFVKLGYKKLSFAAPMKLMLQAILGHIQDDKKEEVLPEFGVSYRHMAQTLGTEWGRNLINPDMWVRLLERQLRPGGKYVISDVRFDNEAKFIRELGGKLFHVTRNITGRVDSHQSEAGLFLASGDSIVRNERVYSEYVTQCAGIAELEVKARSRT